MDGGIILKRLQNEKVIQHSQQRPLSSQILNAKLGISAETALRLSRYFGNSARFWMNLQTRYELVVTERDIGLKVNAEVEKAA